MFLNVLWRILSPKPLLLFLAYALTAVAIRNSFRLWARASSRLLSTSSLPATRGVSRLVSHLLCPSPRISSFSKWCWCPSWKMVIMNKEEGPGCAHHSCSVMASRWGSMAHMAPYAWPELYMVLNLSICICKNYHTFVLRSHTLIQQYSTFKGQKEKDTGNLEFSMAFKDKGIKNTSPKILKNTHAQITLLKPVLQTERKKQLWLPGFRIQYVSNQGLACWNYPSWCTGKKRERKNVWRKKRVWDVRIVPHSLNAIRCVTLISIKCISKQENPHRWASIS